MNGLTSEGVRRNIQISQKPGVTLGSSKQGTVSFGRVIKVILQQSDISEQTWKNLGYSQCLYGIFYQKLFEETKTDVASIDEKENRNFAYCYQTSLRRLPIENEIVSLETTITGDKSEEYGSIPMYRTYWKDILPIWNHPNLNQYPDTVRNGDNATGTGKYFIESEAVNPLQMCPGDYSVEGRYGNSLRFGGTWYDNSPIATKNVNGNPYIILRNGQGVDNGGEGDKALYEDINLDSGSIYLTTGHKIPLKQANSKYDAWINSKGPVLASNYGKSQILQNSDRVFINGRDDVEIVAKNAVGISSGEVNVDGNTQVSLDAKTIYLGSNAQNKKEPCLKGDATTSMLSNIIDELLEILTTIIDSSSDPGIFIGSLKSSAAIHKEFLINYQNQLKKLHSTKIYVE